MKPQEHSACVFCDQLLLGRVNGPWDTILAETKDYAIVPSKGSLVPGWLLVVSKKHVLCAGALPDEGFAGLVDAIELCKRLVGDAFGPPTLFEHGPARVGTALGCGIDHLHIHVAPLGFSISEAVNKMFPGTV